MGWQNDLSQQRHSGRLTFETHSVSRHLIPGTTTNQPSPQQGIYEREV